MKMQVPKRTRTTIVVGTIDSNREEESSPEGATLTMEITFFSQNHHLYNCWLSMTRCMYSFNLQCFWKP